MNVKLFECLTYQREKRRERKGERASGVIICVTTSNICTQSKVVKITKIGEANVELKKEQKQRR